MYANYQVKERLSKKKLLLRLLLAIIFLLSFGFAGGVLFLLFFMVPIEQWLVDRGASQRTTDLILSAMTLGWILFGMLATVVYGRLLLMRRNLLTAAGVSCLSVVAACVVFFFLLDTDLMVAAGRLGQETAESERLAFGPYPDARKLEELDEQGYDGVISLLNPAIPFEEVLLRQERRNARDVGITMHSEPMLPWISENEKSLEAIVRLTSQEDKQFYIHCYLGKHRVDLVKRRLESVTGEDPAAESEPLPKNLERGRVVSYDEGRIVLGPYPTDDEWLDVVLRRDVEEIVSTLDPDNPNDVPWIEKEEKIAKENDLTFTLRPLDPDSPDPDAVREIVRYVQGSDRSVYLHDFLVSRRFEALESALDDSFHENAKTNDPSTDNGQPSDDQDH